MTYGPASIGGGNMAMFVLGLIAIGVLLWLIAMPSSRRQLGEHGQQLRDFVFPERAVAEQVEQTRQQAAAAAVEATPAVSVADSIGFDLSEFTARFGAVEQAPQVPEIEPPPMNEW